METYFLKLFSYHQPRRVRVVENILTNRRTVANLFWAQQYGILNWLGAYRGLRRVDYDAQLQELVQAQLLTLSSDHQAQLTAKGVAFQEEQRAGEYRPHFFDWYWVANTNRLETRVMLGAQVASEYAYHNSHYVPLAAPYSELMTVKNWFRRYRDHQLVTKVYQDLHRLAVGLASVDQRLATALAYTLIGHQQNSWTAPQLAANLALNSADARVLYHDLLLAIGAYCLRIPGVMQDLVKDLLVSSPLSHSAQQTLAMYRQTPALEQIAQRRHLHLSTIREHLLTVAILMPNQLDWDRLLPANVRQRLAHRYPGHDVTNWQFQSNQDDDGADFFTFRLYQIYQGRGNHD